MPEPGQMTSPTAGLPAEVTSFVGRRSERAHLKTMLGESRLVTLTGFGGMGKTRLALRTATDLRRAFADGVYFVSLGSESDPHLLPHDIATALGLQGRSTRAAPTSLVDYLAPREVLLVIDNCEHLVDAVAMLVDTLLRTCPRLRVLATSREPLRIQGESVHAVAPLTVPPREPAPDASLTEYESVALFLDRARLLIPDFELTADNRGDVADICRTLEGIPLAIELAAGRLRAQAPREIHQQLTEHWSLLNRGARTAPDRQRTMAACIEWSFNLCTEQEQDLWARTSVFVDGFELDAAVAVCAGPDEENELADLLLSLVDKSILTATQHHGHMRFRLLPPLRQRGLTQLRETDRLLELRRRHRDWMVTLSEQVRDEWVSPRQIDWIHRMRRERGNMNTALEFCWTQTGEAGPGLVMGANLNEFGLADGLFRPGRLWFDRLLASGTGSEKERALALRTACWWAAMQGDLERALPCLQEGVELAEGVGGLTRTMLTQAEAFVAMFSGDVESASTLFDRAVAGFKEVGEVSQLAQTYALMALNHTFLGDVDAALAAHDECIAITEPAGESWYRAYSLWIAGLAAWGSGNETGATALQKESLALKRLMNDRLGIGVSLEALAWIVAPRDPARAATMLGAAQNEWDKIETSTEALPGLSVSHAGCVDQATALLGQEAYDAAYASGRAMSQAEALALALDEAPPRAAAASTRRRQGSTSLTPRERQIADLVHQGLNNKEIAATLVISKRTAETHVEHILTKLGFTNRNQIAAWVAEQSPTQPAS
jgi:serine/threonine-protein kinase PknK